MPQNALVFKAWAFEVIIGVFLFSYNEGNNVIQIDAVQLLQKMNEQLYPLFTNPISYYNGNDCHTFEYLTYTDV